MASVDNVRATLADPRDDESEPRHDEPDAEHEPDPEHEDGVEGTRRRKKRRVIQNSDRKYCCTHDGCVKKYSRAEHLYRHQLNRTWTNFHDSRYFVHQPPSYNH